MQEISLNSVVKEASELIDNYLDYQTYLYELPGLAVGIFVDNEIVFQKEYGYADVEAKKKFSNHHLFRIASHSKLFTATAIMMLYNEGKLSLDDKVTKYVPWFTSDNDKNLQDITIRHLLTHTSGLSCDGKKDYVGKNETLSLEELKTQLKEGLSVSKTNEVVKYSNIGYVLLGQIIESISQQEFGQFIQTKILDPLEMSNTYIDVSEKNRPLHVVGYGTKYPRENRERFSLFPSGLFQPAAGLSSTVSDLIKFYQAHLFGNDILLPDDLKREMQRIQVKMGNNIRGLGFELSNKPEGKIAGHTGGEVGFRSKSGFFQDKRVIIVVFCNATNIGIEGFFYGLCHLVETLDSMKHVFLQESESSLDFSSIVGLYDSLKGWGPELFSQIKSKLVLLNPENKYPGGSMQILEHKKDYIFTPTNESPTAKPGEDIEFIKNKNGEIILLDSKKGEHKRFEYSY
ncbi:MAG: beta-lactamase family protein [Candidatus Heimdallarchaeota archaeon]|nr:beta-lactamase family protein [Candidatus Heimdallarchaeota archaeon]MBY8995857.1 beta-lactamase family protein [Candidatus Heimdallarchaeota archaeon]